VVHWCTWWCVCVHGGTSVHGGTGVHGGSCTYMVVRVHTWRYVRVCITTRICALEYAIDICGGVRGMVGGEK